MEFEIRDGVPSIVKSMTANEMMREDRPLPELALYALSIPLPDLDDEDPVAP